MPPLANQQLTLRQLWGGIVPGFFDAAELPSVPGWPPDMFALCCYALRQGGAYVGALTRWTGDDTEDWAVFCGQVAAEWIRDAAFGGFSGKVPERVAALWADVTARLDEDLLNAPDATLRRALLSLCALADDACRFAVALGNPHRSYSKAVLICILRALNALMASDRSTLCELVPPNRIRVLPRQRCPQKGLTIRSLSLYVGLVETPDMAPRFDAVPIDDDVSLSILVVPWPLEVFPSQFSPSKSLANEMPTMPVSFGFFSYDPEDPGEALWEWIGVLLDEAAKAASGIKLVLLPELAIPRETGERLAERLAERGIGLVAGVAKEGAGERHAANQVLIALPGAAPVLQGKHHRWQLEENQIRQYSLGGSLHPGRKWWEHIDLTTRVLTFTRLQPWLDTCILICEDLARPDPAGDLVRALGPGLTIALLMDGPQLETRWAARHATTLAEDPGSSVLTLTSLGMAGLSRPRVGVSRKRVVGLWKEQDLPIQELELPQGSDAAVITLSMKAVADWSADGRRRRTAVPILSAFYPLMSRFPQRAAK